jgi:hypothetical protein
MRSKGGDSGVKYGCNKIKAKLGEPTPPFRFAENGLDAKAAISMRNDHRTFSSTASEALRETRHSPSVS